MKSGKGEGLERRARIDLGLSILLAKTRGKIEFTHQGIADFCDCHKNSISEIERVALLKIRNSPIIRALLREKYE